MAKSLILDFFRGDVVDTLNVQVRPLRAGLCSALVNDSLTDVQALCMDRPSPCSAII